MGNSLLLTSHTDRLWDSDVLTAMVVNDYCVQVMWYIDTIETFELYKHDSFQTYV